MQQNTSTIEKLFLNRKKILDFLSKNHMIFDHLGNGRNSSLYFSLEEDPAYEIDSWKTKDKIAKFLEKLEIPINQDIGRDISILTKDFNSHERNAELVSQVFIHYKKYFTMMMVDDPVKAKANSCINDKDIDEGWALSKERKHEIEKLLKYNSVEKGPFKIVVDGIESISPTSIVDNILTDLFINGTDDEVKTFLELLKNVLSIKPKKPVNEAKIKAKITELFKVNKLSHLKLYNSNSKKKPTQLDSHALGIPYIEKGEQWPTIKNEPLIFAFQIMCDKKMNLPKDFKVLQVFYTNDDELLYVKQNALFVKVYSKISKAKLVNIKVPYGEQTGQSIINFEPNNSLPDETTKFNDKVIALIKEVEPLDYEDSYKEYLSKYLKNPKSFSFIGGHPRWVHDEEEFSKDWKFILQIDQDITDLSGVFYLFYNEKTGKFKFTMQCD